MACAAATKDERGRRVSTVSWLLGLLIFALIAAGAGALLTAGVLKLSSAIGKQWEDEDLSCDPRVYVLDLYAPALLNHNNTSLNSSVFIDLGFIRGAPVSGSVAMYRDLSINLYYGEDPSYPVANRTIPSFRMGERRRVHYSAVAEAPRLPWEDAFNKLSAGSTVDLRLELLGEFKPMDYCGGYRIYCNCDWSKFQVQAQVWVDASTHMLSNTPILFTI